MEGKRRTKILESAILAAVIAAMVVPTFSVDVKCAACNAVAGEIELGLTREKPRIHLGMRHHLDSKGQREGKVIDYRVSELRVVELLDGLCDKMQDYTLKKLGSGKKESVRVKDYDNLKIRLLEETEDELTEQVKKGSVQPGCVSKILCQDLSKHCLVASDSSSDEDGEL